MTVQFEPTVVPSFDKVLSGIVEIVGVSEDQARVAAGEAALQQDLGTLCSTVFRLVIMELIHNIALKQGWDDTVIGGGNAKKLKKAPPGCRLGSNANAFIGGYRMWEPANARHTAHAPERSPHDQPKKRKGART